MNVTGDPGRDTGNNGAVRHILGHDSAGADLGGLSDCHAGKNGGVAADRCMALDQCGNDDPVGLRLQTAVRVDGARVSVIGEHHPVADKNAVLERHAFAEEGVAGDFAVFADDDVFLDFNEGADARSRANRAAVQIHKISMVNNAAVVQLDVRGNHPVSSPTQTGPDLAETGHNRVNAQDFISTEQIFLCLQRELFSSS
ncbi:hypothetical protein RHECNPAF_2190073 [Rhizobium etli CNPAF512]|nr:hypothetical protein RHECNPAF_2190073 [Rhizobium etli CNPAF512]